MKTRTLLYQTALILLIQNHLSFGQVSNDDCANATDLGILDGFPLGACVMGDEDTCFVGSNINSVPDFPYFSMTGCSGYSNSTASPANDVWYKVKTPGFNFIRIKNGWN